MRYPRPQRPLGSQDVIVKHSPTLDFDLTPAGQFELFLPGYSFTEIVDEMQRLVLFEICQLLHGLLGCEIGR